MENPVNTYHSTQRTQPSVRAPGSVYSAQSLWNKNWFVVTRQPLDACLPAGRLHRQTHASLALPAGRQAPLHWQLASSTREFASNGTCYRRTSRKPSANLSPWDLVRLMLTSPLRTTAFGLQWIALKK